jgi:type II secretory pathway pseudopilin PulG
MKREGITIIEIVIAIGVIAVIGGAIIVATNPFNQIAGSRNQQRTLHLQALMNAIRQNITESGTNTFVCTSGELPTTPTLMSATSGYNIAPCLVPSYLTALPFDPNTPGGRYVSNTDYVTGYAVQRSTTTGQVTLTAPGAERGVVVSLIR